MPIKIQADETISFLYMCLKNSDYKSIDFHAVGDKCGIKASAASMRFYRLSRALEKVSITSSPQNISDKIDKGDKTDEAAKPQQRKRSKNEDDEDDEDNRGDEDNVRPQKKRRTAYRAAAPEPKTINDNPKETTNKFSAH